VKLVRWFEYEICIQTTFELYKKTNKGGRGGKTREVDFMGRFIKVFSLAVMLTASVVLGQSSHAWNDNGNLLTVFDGDEITIVAGATGTLNIPNNATVKIVSAGESVVNNGERLITLNIPATSKVTWEAKYSMTLWGGVSAWNAVNITGGGEFILVDGGEIRVTGNDSRAINAINSAVTINGGVVSTIGGMHRSRAINAANSTIIVNGGVVSGEGGMTTINEAISVTGTSIVRVNGGLVLAQNRTPIGANGVINTTPTGDVGGTIIGYVLGTYCESSTLGLEVLPVNTEISWGREFDSVGRAGILYPDGFFFVFGVELISGCSMIWNGDAAPLNSKIKDGDIILIAADAGGTLARGTLNVPDNATVTITCPATRIINDGHQIVLNIPISSKVIWSARHTSHGTPLSVIGGGELVLAESGEIRRSLTSGAAILITNSKVTVDGGSVSASGDGSMAVNAINSAVTVNDGVISGDNTTINATANSTVIINGGEVRATALSREAINATNSIVTINGGTVRASGTVGTAIVPTNSTIVINGGVVSSHSSSGGVSGTIRSTTSNDTNTTIIIDGGELRATGSNRAICSDRSSVIINRGIVSADFGEAILSNTIEVNGGLVIARNSNLITSNAGTNRGVISVTPTATVEGTIIGLTLGMHTIGSTDGLIFLPEDANVFWGLNNGQSGIFYLDDFFAVDGVTLMGETFIRSRQQTNSKHGILLENAIVSDLARISVITPEPATINLRIIDNLGNVVFETGGRSDENITWNLTNSAGRFVGNGMYLVVVEAIGISGRRFTYSARIGVNR
jgi:hypothetical protein